MTTPQQVVAFWVNAGPRAWFAKSESFDTSIRDEFLEPHYAASRRDLDQWLDTPEGALALLLLLDQFPRNMFRASAHAFATDPLARHIADRAIAAGHDRAVEARLRPFFYLPYEHSEDAADQARAVALAEALAEEAGDQETLKWARVHADIIARFGRFPHRNRVLGRETRADEQAFLDEGGFSG